MFVNQGVRAYAELQLARENTLIGKGTGFEVVERLLRLNEPDEKPYVEVVLLSQNSPDLSLRAFNSIEHYGLTIKTGSFTSGRSLGPFIPAWGVDLFLSNEHVDVMAAILAGAAAARLGVVPPERQEMGPDEVRIAFDGDAVVFSKESDEIYKKEGLPAFMQHERENATKPMAGGPFGNFLKKLSLLRHIYMNDQGVSRVRVAIVTARNAPAHARVILTLRAWGTPPTKRISWGCARRLQFSRLSGLISSSMIKRSTFLALLRLSPQDTFRAHTHLMNPQYLRANAIRAAYVLRLRLGRAEIARFGLTLLPPQHPQNLVRRLHVREDTAHRFQLAIMGLPRDLGHGVADDDGAIVFLDPATHGIRDANACGDTCHDARGHTEVAKNSVELRVRKASEPFLGDQVLTLMRLQLVDDLGTPCALDTMRAVSSTRLQPQPPVGEGGVGVIRLQDMRHVHYGPPCGPEGICKSLHLRDRPHEEWHIDVELGVFRRPPAETPVGMQEVVLHVHDDEGGASNVRAHWE